MIRLGLALVVLAATATAHAQDWSIRSPDGWVRVEPAGAFDEEQFPPSDTHRYTSPDTPSDELAVTKVELEQNGTPRGIAEALLARAVVRPNERVEKRQTSGRVAADAIGEMTIVDGDIVRQYRVVTSPNHRDRWIDAVVARCTTSRAAATTCADAMATVKIEVKSQPKIDDGVFLRLPWIAMLAILCGVVWSVMIIRYLLRRRAMRKKTPLSDGEMVTLTGRVRAMEPYLTAPLSGTQCVMHRSRMYLLGSPNAKDNAVTESARFVVETPNGDVIVDSTPELDLVPSPVVPRLEKRELSFMMSRNIPEARHRDAGFDEIVIAPGATVVIRGMIRVERDHGAGGERGYRDDAPTVTRLVGTPDKPLTIKKTW